MNKTILPIVSFLLISFGSIAQAIYQIDETEIKGKIDNKLEDNIPGIAIGLVVNDSLIFFHSAGYADKQNKSAISKETVFQIGSLTKPIIATLVVKMYANGQLDIHAPLENYLPNTIIPQASIPITLAHLLSHSSGLPQEPINRIDLKNTPTVPAPYSKKELYIGLKSTDLLFPPGTYVQYSNLGFQLAGYVLERVANTRLESLLKKELLDPLKMNSTFAQHSPAGLTQASHYWNIDNAKEAHPRWEIGEIWGNGGLSSTIQDMSRFLSLQFKSSSIQSSSIPAEYLKLSQTPRIPANRYHSEFLGLGWYINKREDIGTHLYHSGDADGHSSYLSFSPEDGVGFIIFANRGGVAEEIGEELIPIIYEDLFKLKNDLLLSFQKSDWDLMIRATDRHLRLNPSNSRAHYFKGKALYMKKDYHHAEKHLQTAISDGLYKDYAYFYLASCMAHQGRHKKGKEYLRKAVDLGFIDGEALLDDVNLKKYADETSYKKLARWAH